MAILMTGTAAGRWLEIQVHVEQLVLHGFDAADGESIAAAIERELEWLLSTGAREARSSGAVNVKRPLLHSRPMIEGISGLVSSGSRSTIGNRVARAIYLRVFETTDEGGHGWVQPEREGYGHADWPSAASATSQ